LEILPFDIPVFSDISLLVGTLGNSFNVFLNSFSPLNLLISIIIEGITIRFNRNEVVVYWEFAIEEGVF
jgi:hypothetical protein